ncbi:unnamed product [Ostreococcus tauri]|uniref:Unnamed product n=1 Tax=Ostreococcus tauri TaxID=70448 RepID=A0A090N4S1_OSTTA|nr:unnamed product [Ostreococcus tauri]CEG01200.1 unnamed product [Ostreococcus tauri]|eukprot:XP_003075288.2 unnamed product [Ostreococcus tauri]
MKWLGRRGVIGPQTGCLAGASRFRETRLMFATEVKRSSPPLSEERLRQSRKK